MRTRKYRRTTPEEIETIKKLSPNHTVKDIAKTTGLHPMVIMNIQRNEKYGITSFVRNPNLFRHKKEKSLEEQGLFDVDAHFRKYIF